MIPPTNLVYFLQIDHIISEKNQKKTNETIMRKTMYKQTERHINRQIDISRLTDRQTVRQEDKQSDRQANIQTDKQGQVWSFSDSNTENIFGQQ